MSPIARQDSHEPPPASTVADRLKSARRRRFVGRAAELELFLGALAASEPPFSVLWIHGPGGVGKTALLGALAEAAADAGVDVVTLDLRAIEPSPPAFMAELGRALGLPAEASPQEALAGQRACGAAAGHLRGCGRARGLAAGAVRPGAAGVRAGRGGGQERSRGGVAAGSGVGRPAARGVLAQPRAGRRAGLPAWRGCRGGAAGVDARALARPPARVVAAGGRALAAAGGSRCGYGAVGVGRGARRGGAAGGELPGRGAESAPSAGARMRGPRAAYHGGPAGQRLWRSRGRGVVLVAARPVVHGVTGRTACFRTTSRER